MEPEEKKVVLRDVNEEDFTILNPDGSELVTSNNPLVFHDIRLQIIKKQLDGYSIKFRDEIFNINKSDGKFFDKR